MQVLNTGLTPVYDLLQYRTEKIGLIQDWKYRTEKTGLKKQDWKYRTDYRIDIQAEKQVEGNKKCKQD